MAEDKELSQLEAITNPSANDLMYIVSGGNARKIPYGSVFPKDDYYTKTQMDTALAGKEPTISVTANRALVSDANGKVSASSATATEVGYLSGVTGAIQTQINGKQNTLTFDATPTAQSTNPVTSGGIKTALDKKANGEGLTFKMVDGVLNVTTPIEIVPFATGTDAQIKAMIDAYYADAITWEEMGWNIGDTRLIHLDAMQAPNPDSSDTWAAQDIIVVIAAHDYSELKYPIYGHTKSCITLSFREAISSNANVAGEVYLNGEEAFMATFVKWKDLYIREYLNNVVFNAITNTLKNEIKQIKHHCHTYYNTSESEQVEDRLYLPSYPEIYGTNSYQYYTPTDPTEGLQLQYYETSTNRVKYGNNNGSAGTDNVYWWLSSASSMNFNNSIDWCIVAPGGSINKYNTKGKLALIPIFAI